MSDAPMPSMTVTTDDVAPGRAVERDDRRRRRGRETRLRRVGAPGVYGQLDVQRCARGVVEAVEAGPRLGDQLDVLAGGRVGRAIGGHLGERRRRRRAGRPDAAGGTRRPRGELTAAEVAELQRSIPDVDRRERAVLDVRARQGVVLDVLAGDGHRRVARAAHRHDERQDGDRQRRRQAPSPTRVPVVAVPHRRSTHVRPPCKDAAMAARALPAQSPAGISAPGFGVNRNLAAGRETARPETVLPANAGFRPSGSTSHAVKEARQRRTFTHGEPRTRTRAWYHGWYHELRGTSYAGGQNAESPVGTGPSSSRGDRI